MPSAANAKSEKPASAEATDNSPVRQIITILEHKIRNLEKRKGKLTQYRDLQKAGKELNGDQRVAVAKYDEVVQTLDFARDIAKQIASIATAAERDAKKQAKKDAWVRNATETSKIREVLLILDCLTQMGNAEARDDFLNGSNGAAKLTEEDLKILDDLYPEVTPKHEPNDEGQPAFHAHTSKAAEHLCSIIDGKPKEVLGTTYTRIKEIVAIVHESGYFDQVAVEAVVEVEEAAPVVEEVPEPVEPEPEPEAAPAYPPAGALPVPPAPAVVPAPAYPLRPLPPITLQEVEHAYFAQQYPQQRPIAEVIGSQNFFFLQESELDSPVGTPQPPLMPGQPSPPGPIPTQTFTNQQFMAVHPRGPEGAMPLPPQPHFPPHPEHAFAGGVPLHPHHAPVLPHHVLPAPAPAQHAPPPAPLAPAPVTVEQQQPEDRPPVSPAENKTDDDWVESRSPEREDGGERKTQGQGDGQGRFRRYGRGGRGAPNGYRGRGSFQGRQGGDGYRGRHDGGYQGRANREDGYQGRGNKEDGYQGRSNKEDGYQGRSNKEDGYQGRSNKEDGGYQGRNNKEDGGYQGRSNKEDGGYQGRNHKDDGGYQGRNKEDGGYQGRSNKEEGGYRSRQHDGYGRRTDYQSREDGYYGNGDTEHGENGRERYADGAYQGGFKSRGRGPRGAPRGPSRPPRNHYNNRKPENVE